MIAGVVGLGNCKVQLDPLDFTQWGQIVCVLVIYLSTTQWLQCVPPDSVLHFDHSRCLYVSLDIQNTR
jgi:hypothetical protein